MVKKYYPEGYLQKCIYCKEDVLITQDKKMVALEIPYLNLYLHKECYLIIESTLLEYLKENLENYLKVK